MRQRENVEITGRNVSAGLKVSIGQHSETGPRPANDDSWGVLIPEGDVLESKGIAAAIADGVSASAAAKEASETCVKTFLTDYYCTHDSWQVKTAVGRVLGAVNNWLHAQGYNRELGELGLVSTFSGLVLKGGLGHLFHVGDSRIWRFREGSLQQLTRDHRMPGPGGKDYLARAMGSDLDVKIDYQSFPLARGDVFLFTTDGVHDFLSADSLEALLSEVLSPLTRDAETQDLDVLARSIVQAALAAGSDDNATCQLVRVDDPGERDAAAHIRRLQELPFPPAELGPGHVMDGFRIIRELHATSRSQVFLAEDMESGAQVAIKTPSVNFADDPSYIEQFTREEWIGARLESPHVLRVFPAAGRRRFLYTVMEYVPGQSLRQWMHDHPKPSLSEVRDILEQIAKGLRAFHRREMFHQDLKPENIRIDPEGTVKIIDFGSTRVAGLTETFSSVAASARYGPGTVEYSAPELMAGHPAGRKSDIFSLGVIAYEMLTGALPYGKPLISPEAARRAHYISARKWRGDLPLWVDGALARAVAVDPARRYGHLSEFLMDMTRPNPDFVTNASPPLLERNPAAFWRAAFLVMFLLNLVLWYYLVVG